MTRNLVRRAVEKRGRYVPAPTTRRREVDPRAWVVAQVLNAQDSHVHSCVRIPRPSPYQYLLTVQRSEGKEYWLTTFDVWCVVGQLHGEMQRSFQRWAQREEDPLWTETN